jgi:hypothetical protein
MRKYVNSNLHTENVSEYSKNQILTCVCSRSHVNLRITAMMVYTEEVQSDSRCSDLQTGAAWFESQLGQWLSSLLFFLC